MSASNADYQWNYEQTSFGSYIVETGMESTERGYHLTVEFQRTGETDPPDEKMRLFFARLQAEASQQAEITNLTKKDMMKTLPDKAWDKLTDTDAELPPAETSGDSFIIHTPTDRGDAISKTTYKVIPPISSQSTKSFLGEVARAAAFGFVFGISGGSVRTTL
ncbi:hypothetical protein JCM24511_04005 [Saitozyma sp. JCM 24511]|nr:hypothetical protein JCM24511_04005 [Saitozyma sp. JCM 24511]